MEAVEWLLRCRACGIIYAAVSAPVDGHTVYDLDPSGSVNPCHPTPSGEPGLDVVRRDNDPLKVVRQWLGAEEVNLPVKASVVFYLHYGNRMWALTEMS